MADEEQETTKIELSCPTCGREVGFTNGSANQLACTSGHDFTLGTLFLAQSMRADSLIHSALRFLNQQEVLMRELGRRMMEAHAPLAVRMLTHADCIAQSRAALLEFLKGKSPGACPVGSRYESLN